MESILVTEEYHLDKKSEKILDSLFTHHPPNESQIQRYKAIRLAAKETAKLTVKLAPESEERKQALIHLRAFVMWANASIAINEAD